jgi:large subunit ribosomal protein L23
MPDKEISEKELDAMIDASIKQQKGEGKAEKPKAEPKKAEKPKAEKSVANEKAAAEKTAPAKKSNDGTPSPKAKEAKKPAKEATLKAVEGYDPWKVLEYPHLTEKSMNLVERNNVIVFIVKAKATKAQVRDAVEKGFGVRVESVRVEVTRKNQKKAYIRLAEGVLASDIATRLGMI